MSVDTKEHLEGRIADSLACGKYLDAAEYITLLAQLIADEREAAQPEPAAAGVPETRMVVPEWFDYTWFTSDVAALKVRDAIESEIARRVAEAERKFDGWHPPSVNANDTSRIRHLEQQLAASQAESERLTRVLREQDEYRLASEKELARLRDENARLTRPVEDERSFFASDANNDVSEVVGVLRHRAERNAREAAEAERDELESIVNRFCEDVLAWSKAGQKDDDLPFPLRVRGSSAGEEWTMHNLPLVLASPVACLKERYRAEKGKVQQ